MNSTNRYIGNIRENRLYKIAIITLYAVINLWLYIMLNTPPAKSYEISIYAAYSLIFWFLFIFTLILGICLTVLFIVMNVRLWRYSLPAILIADTVVLFLPIIRNYEFCAWGGWDIFAHLAWSKFIVNSGNIMSRDLYPATHILTTAPDLLSLLNPVILAAIICFIFFILYVLSLFILGKVVFKDDKAAVLLATFGSPLMFSFAHYAFIPFSFALFLFPLIFYIMHKIVAYKMEGSEVRGAYYTCLFIILALFIVFCHPMVTLILLLILGVLYGYIQICRKCRLEFSFKLNILNLIAIVGITFAFWYINFQSVLNMGEKVVSALLGVSDTETILTHNLDMLDQSGVSLLRVIEGFIKVYGPIVIYFAAALLITIYLIYRFLTKRTYADEMVYIAFFLLSIAFGATLTLGYFVVFELIRATSFAIIMATIVCSIGFYILFTNTGMSSSRKNILILIAVFILCSVSILSVFNLYYSPWTLSPGTHMTEMEVSGTDWFLMYEDASIPTNSNSGLFHKYARYFQELHKMNVQQPRVILNEIPTHFGYDQNEHLTQSINTSGNSYSYMITNEYMKQTALAYPEEMQSTRKQFLRKDFFKLNNDITVTKLYTNREWELWMIQYK